MKNSYFTFEKMVFENLTIFSNYKNGSFFLLSTDSEENTENQIIFTIIFSNVVFRNITTDASKPLNYFFRLMPNFDTYVIIQNLSIFEFSTG